MYYLVIHKDLLTILVEDEDAILGSCTHSSSLFKIAGSLACPYVPYCMAVSYSLFANNQPLQPSQKYLICFAK